MNSSLTFQGQILRIKKRILIHRVAKAILTGVLLFSCVYGVAIGLDLWAWKEFSIANQPWFLELTLVGSLGFAVIPAVFNKRRLIDILIEIDHRLNLHDSISTAFEYRHFGKQSELSGLLMESAAQHLFRLSSRKLFPPKFSWLHLLLGVLILLHLLIAIKMRNPSQTESAVVSATAIQLVDAYLHKQVIHKKSPSEGSRSTTRKKITNDLEKLSQSLKNPSASRDIIAGTIGKMLKEIESGQTIVAKELGEQLKLHNIEEIPVQAMQQFEKWSLANITQLQNMVDRMFDHQVPETISERLAILQEQQQLKDVLDNLLDDMDDPASLGKNANRLNRDKKSRRYGSGSGLNSADDTDQASSGSRSLVDSDLGDAHPDESGDMGSGRENDDSGDSGLDGGEASDDVVSPTAGKGKADGSLKSQRPIDSAKGGALQDRSLPSSRDYYRAHIRTMTSIGQSKLDNQKVIREYQKEVEGILQKEEIPLNYRAYIRNYFLSIGLRKEN